MSEKTSQEKPSLGTPRGIFATKLQRFHALVSIIRQGISSEDNPEFVELRQWLKDNFKSEYLDMF